MQISDMLKMEYPLISVIVPIYNVEMYLQACIERIIPQSFTDFELLLIDDGSSDGSGAICDAAASKDRRIIVIHKRNEGVSVARNTGIERAHGKWITFVDSDDTVEHDYLKRLIRKAEEFDSDLVTSGIRFDYGDGDESFVLEETGLKSFQNESDFFDFVTQELITSPVAKLYKKAIIDENGLRFNPSLSIGEDRDFNVRYLNVARNACSTSYVGYNYRKYTPGSLTKCEYPLKFRYDYQYWTLLRDFTHNKGFHSPTTEKMLVNRLFHLINDKVMSIMETSMPLREKRSLLKDTFNEVDDFGYLAKQKGFIDYGNNVIKNLVLYRQSFLLSLLSVLFYGRR